MTNSALAFHEAGHAVIGRVLTLVCGPASVRPDDVSRGRAVIQNPHECICEWEKRGRYRDHPFAAAMHARIITVMAGGEAVAVLIGPDLPRGDGADIGQIRLMMKDLDPPDPPRCKARLRAMTRMLIRRHKPRIERVATAIRAEETLTAAQLDKLVGRSVEDVKPKPRDLPRMNK